MAGKLACRHYVMSASLARRGAGFAGRSAAQAQKMESIGTLAGEVAHVFNNMLTAIIGVSSWCSAPRPNRLVPDVDRDREAATRATALTASC
jgi:hypothetical protein